MTGETKNVWIDPDQLPDELIGPIRTRIAEYRKRRRQWSVRLAGREFTIDSGRLVPSSVLFDEFELLSKLAAANTEAHIRQAAELEAEMGLTVEIGKRNGLKARLDEATQLQIATAHQLEAAWH